MIYRTKDGDMLDAICHSELGRADLVVQVLEANPHLADLGPVYPAGVLITLPTVRAETTKPTVRLWGTRA